MTELWETTQETMPRTKWEHYKTYMKTAKEDMTPGVW